MKAPARLRPPLLLVCLHLALVAGCSSPPKPLPRAHRPAAAEYDLAPKQLIETVKQVVTSPPLSLPIEQEHKGTIITGYQEFPGDWHIARRWQERTRYRISVIPDFDEPTRHSRLEVTEESQVRATEGQEWHDDPDVQRPDRAASLLQQIDRRAKGGAAAPAPSGG